MISLEGTCGNLDLELVLLCIGILLDQLSGEIKTKSLETGISHGSQDGIERIPVCNCVVPVLVANVIDVFSVAVLDDLGPEIVGERSDILDGGVDCEPGVVIFGRVCLEEGVGCVAVSPCDILTGDLGPVDA